MVRKILPCFIILLFMAFFDLSAAGAQQQEAAPEPYVKYDHYYLDYKINDDGTGQMTADYGVTLLKQDAVEYAKQQTISYSTSAEGLEIIAAYTKKADGRRIDVPKENYQLDVSSGKNGDNPAFSDQSMTTIIFPEVAVGDTLMLSYKRSLNKPIFPKQFSVMQNFEKDFPYDDVSVKFDLPLSMDFKCEANGMTEKTNKTENGRKFIEWIFQNKNPIKIKYKDELVLDPDKEPGYMVSTLPSYAAIAAAYGVSANAKATVTDRIKKVADDITQGKTTPRDQAQAITSWITNNITYAGNCIGVGAVVPRDLDFVLNNKMGDCKDHATLLQSLLEAKGIHNTQALINATNIYTLPKIPVVSAVNHVINYIPSLDIFVDSTSSMPFGMLPLQLAGKPVLLVNGYKEGMTTPLVAPTALGQNLDVHIKIGEDGSAEGKVVAVVKGDIAVAASEAFKKLPKDREKEFVENVMKGYHLEGTATLNHGAIDENAFTYQYGFDFSLKNFVKVNSAGAFYVYPPLVDSMLGSNIANNKNNIVMDQFICWGGVFEEKYVYEFPKNIAILAVPNAVSASNAIESYEATYKQDDHTLSVTRKYTDKTKGPTCNADVSNQYHEVAEKAWPDLTSQVVYK